MNCAKCGKQLMAGAKFCMYCGSKVEKACKKCGAQLPDEARFCFACGTQVNEGAPISSGNPPVSAAILADEVMANLSKISAETEGPKHGGFPVMDNHPDGGQCDCAVGECDCDGSIWS